MDRVVGVYSNLNQKRPRCKKGAAKNLVIVDKEKQQTKNIVNVLVEQNM